MTLLADYGLRTRVWIPSGAIVELLGEFGVTPGGARAAISRLARKGMLESSRKGRLTAYRLAPDAAAGLAIGGAAIAALPSSAESWDGRWTLVAFSLPEAGDAPRRALRQRLRWLGFAPLYDALWVSPLAPVAGVREALRDAGSGAVTVFRARHVELDAAAGRAPLDAWDLAGISRQYGDFVARWSPLLPRIRTGGITGTEALRARTAVMDTYRHFLALDPLLPSRLMPPDWPRHPAREVFAAIYDGLLETALGHVRETVARFVDGAPPDLGAHTLADLLGGLTPA